MAGPAHRHAPPGRAHARDRGRPARTLAPGIDGRRSAIGSGRCGSTAGPAGAGSACLGMDVGAHRAGCRPVARPAGQRERTAFDRVEPHLECGEVHAGRRHGIRELGARAGGRTARGAGLGHRHRRGAPAAADRALLSRRPRARPRERRLRPWSFDREARITTAWRAPRDRERGGGRFDVHRAFPGAQNRRQTGGCNKSVIVGSDNPVGRTARAVHKSEQTGDRLVKKSLLSIAVAGVLVAPAYAQQAPTNDEILRQLQALGQRVEKLEQDNTTLRTENEELRARNDRMEATTEYLRDNASATRRQLAEEGPKVAEADRISKAAEWASRISWKADLRYRHEFLDPEQASDDQTRHRIRARFGLSGKVNDTVSATIQLATNGANNDPRSTNQTLGEGNTRKGLGIDLAYAEWKPVDGFALLAGKQPQPWVKPPGLLWDGDITPEGIAVK